MPFGDCSVGTSEKPGNEGCPLGIKENNEVISCPNMLKNEFIQALSKNISAQGNILEIIEKREQNHTDCTSD